MSTQGLDRGHGQFGEILPVGAHIVPDKSQKLFQYTCMEHKTKYMALGVGGGFTWGHGVAMWRGYPFKAYRKHVLQSTLRGYAAIWPYVCWAPIVERRQGKTDMMTHMIWGSTTCGMWGIVFRGSIGHCLNGIGVGIPFGCCFWACREYIYLPLRYAFFQNKREYKAPGWFPIRPMDSYDILEKEIRKEKVDILYPEDFDEDGNAVLQSEQMSVGWG